MKNIFKYTLATAALLTSMGLAQADTVVQKTTVTTQATPLDAKTFTITQFDIDNNGIYTMPEVGERLFYIYDTDGNEIIDNVEFDRANVITVAPVETETYTVVDTNNDGIAEQSSYTYSTFMSETGLARYDANKDGLSAKEFSGTFFLKADQNDDNAVDLEEWKSIYLSSVAGINEGEKFN